MKKTYYFLIFQLGNNNDNNFYCILYILDYLLKVLLYYLKNTGTKRAITIIRRKENQYKFMKKR